MIAYLEILRPSICILTIFAVIVGALIGGVSISYYLLITCLVAFLIAGAGNTINDYFDYETDRINKPHRPIPAAKIRRRSALNYSIILFILAIFLVLFLNVYLITLAFFNIGIILVYGRKLKRLPLIGNFGPSWLAASSFLFGNLITGNISITVLLLFLMAFSSNVGREITKSIEDIEGDKRIRMKTLPIVAGKNFAGWIAMIFILFAIIFSPLPYMLNLLSINYLYLVIITDIIFAFSCFLIFILPKKSQLLMKIAMFIAIVAFLVGII